MVASNVAVSRPVKNNVNLTRASNQWATRPADERFWGIDDMLAHELDSMNNSTEIEVSINDIHPSAADNGEIILSDDTGPIAVTNWSFQQLCNYARLNGVSAPSKYLATLPAPLAAQCLNLGLAERSEDSAQLMIRYENGQATLRSITSKLSRLWNARALQALRPAQDNGWIVPPARPSVPDTRTRRATIEDIIPGQESFGLAVKVGDWIAPAGAYASDRDMFLFMCNPNRVIDLDNDNALIRGFFMWNSEVGAGAWEIETFLCEAICGNHIVWGASDVKRTRLVHKGKNFKDNVKMVENLRATMGELEHRDTQAERLMITRSRAYMLGKDKDETVENLFSQKRIALGKKTLEAGYDAAVEWEHTAGAPPVSAWGIAHGLTRYSQTMGNADERAAIDAGAGRILSLAYNA